MIVFRNFSRGQDQSRLCFKEREQLEECWKARDQKKHGS